MDTEDCEVTMFDFCLGSGVCVLAFLATAIAVLAHYFGLFDLLFSEVDAKTKKNGGDLVAGVLKEHGVKFVFILSGGHISPILVACEQTGIRVIDTRHEVTCAFAADAVSRLSGTIGVACVTAGPGVTNTVTAIQNASMAESPLLLLGGAAATILKGRGALQDIDQMSLFRPLCKYVASVTRVRDVVPVLRKAIQVAQSGTPGPVFVELPIDTLYPYHLVQKELVPGGPSSAATKKSPTLVQRVTQWYMKLYLRRLFAGAFVPRDMSPLPVSYPKASPAQISECAALVKNAKKPLFILGSQITLPPTSAEDVRAALEKMGAPCFLGGMSRGILGKNSPIHIRQNRRDAVKEADVILMVGAIADFRMSYGRILTGRSKKVIVNRKKENLKLNTLFYTPYRTYLADPGSFLVDLARAMGDHQCDPEWPDALKQKDNKKESDNLKKAEQVPEQHLNPLKVLHIAEEVMSENSIIVADGGDFVGSAAYILRPRGPLRWLDPGPFGTLGVGGGFALGAKLCRPDADVWIVYGDGSLGYSVAEFDTFARHGTPVIALIGNDACWSQIAREQVPMFGSGVGCMLAYCNYETVAEGYGGEGLRLDRSHGSEDIKSTLILAQEKSRKEKRPVLVNCLIGKSDFRQGSISV